MSKTDFNFGGYATKVNLKCSDGRTILKDAFKDCDGVTVPLVWQHMHDEPANVLGHALLENREDGVYAYCKCNETDSGKNAKMLVEHGDVVSLSIFANNLIEKSKNVIHGVIREISLVLAGANPGAVIDNIAIQHGDGTIVNDPEEAIIYTGLAIDPSTEKKEPEKKEPEIKHAAEGEETVGDIFDTLSDKQKTAVYAIIASLESDGGALEQSNLTEGENGIMKENVFDGSAIEKSRPHLTHDQFMTILKEAQDKGSFRNAFLAHVQDYGIENIDYLFPDAETVTTEPTLISRDMEWVPVVLNGTRHSPFSRIKTVHADITVETARALGYVKASLKKEEVFGLLRRTTTPTTIYKKQKLDRDDVIDIRDLDVVAWMKREMRIMLDEELARAILVGDGRAVESEDKIDETCIRPIWTDDDMYSHKHQLLVDVDTEGIIDGIIEARKNYKGSGSPSLFISTDLLTDMLLLKDTTGRRLYQSVESLRAELRVAAIVEVPVMADLVRTDDEDAEWDLLGIVVNLRDYTVGAEKGGQVSMFDDFDIDYNQLKYLLETRCCGALTLPKSALVIEKAHA